jgi:F-type H+-transporting ATPase subunit epsilon
MTWTLPVLSCKYLGQETLTKPGQRLGTWDERERVNDMDAACFKLQILTPEKIFFNDAVEAVTVPAPDGRLTVLAHHTPLICPLDVGMIGIKQNGQWSECVNSEGFIEVHHDGAIVFVQACERPEDIDRSRAEQARRRAEELLRQKRSLAEYNQSKIALARAMARLSAAKRRR